MSATILDASALLAFLMREPGAEKISMILDGAIMSSVNLAEVVAKLSTHGMPSQDIETLFENLELQIEEFDGKRAMATGLLMTRTVKAGLSLGDRACIALAEEMGHPAITADKAWLKIGSPAKIQYLR
ncbi:MAG: type II toxin-antitoxin system VapC family toxin [Parvibaculum sp.]